MNVAAIISEYNPFHKGHKHHIDQTKKSGADFVVAIMSGNFVQRSEPAIMQKQARAKTAVLNGVDLVVELPLPFATASAYRFAYGALYIADAMQIINRLSFGSECGDVDLLIKAAKRLNSLDTKGGIKNALQEGLSFPSARESLFYGDEDADILKVLRSPNDILGIEYCRAIQKLNSRIRPYAVKRLGAGHDSKNEDEGFLSASAIREIILKEYRQNKNIDFSKISKYIPKQSLKVLEYEFEKGFAPSDFLYLDLAVLSSLRSKDANYFAKLPDVSEGLENRIAGAVCNASSVEELYSLIKTKRYTLSRVRRIVLSAYLGIEKSFLDSPPPYIRVLAFNEKGRFLLGELKAKAKLPIVTRYADIRSLSLEAKAFYDLEARSTGIYNLSLPSIRAANTEYKDEVFVLLD